MINACDSPHALPIDAEISAASRASASAAAKSPRNTCIELPTVRFSPSIGRLSSSSQSRRASARRSRRGLEVPVRHVRAAQVVQGERDLFALPQLAGDRDRLLAGLDRARRVPAAVDVRHHDVPEGARLGGSVPDPARHHDGLFGEPAPERRVELRGGRRVEERDHRVRRELHRLVPASPAPRRASPGSSRSRRRTGRAAPGRCPAARTSCGGATTPPRCGARRRRRAR